MQEVAPVFEYVPVAQLKHVAEEVAERVDEKVPPAQPVQIEAPANE